MAIFRYVSVEISPCLFKHEAWKWTVGLETEFTYSYEEQKNIFTSLPNYSQEEKNPIKWS